MLAELGYTALAADMYGDGQTAGDPDGAGALMNAVLGNMDAGTARLEAAYDALAGHSSVDAGRMAAIGYCFGGAMVLHGARIGMDLKGVVSFHGALGSFHKPAKGEVKARVLVCHGAADALVSEEEITGFKQEMADGRRRLPLRCVRGRAPRLHQSRGHRERREIRPAAQVRRNGGQTLVGRHAGAVLGDLLIRRRRKLALPPG